MSWMRLLYLLDIFPVPIFVTSILIFAPWPKPIIVGTYDCVVLPVVDGKYRLMATLQAADMVYFVEKVLEEVITTDTPLLLWYSQ